MEIYVIKFEHFYYREGSKMNTTAFIQIIYVQENLLTIR